MVMDRVRIDPPYDEAHVSGVDGNVPPTEVSRVKYVVCHINWNRNWNG